MTQNSFVNFKLIHFLLWIKESHQSPRCSGAIFPNFSCHFPNHKSVFFQILHHSSVSWKILLCTFLAQTFYTLVKRSQCNFLDFRVLGSKFVKFFISLLKRQVNSSSNVASFFITMIHNSSVNFKLIHFLLWIKESHKVPVLRLLSTLVKICQIPHVSYSSNSVLFFSVMKDNSSILF